jgi:DNA-binding NarL/FixJ family response regulator
MGRSQISAKAFAQRNRPSPPVAFAFCERASGTIRFRVDATAAGKLPVEQAASLLAVHCLMSGKTVNDYEVLVILRENFLGSVAQSAQELLYMMARSIQCDVGLSPREQEVLDGVRTLLSNKEIGARLNIKERNVKHAVTALFRKFKVRNRVSLMCETDRRCLQALILASRSVRRKRHRQTADLAPPGGMLSLAKILSDH